MKMNRLIATLIMPLLLTSCSNPEDDKDYFIIEAKKEETIQDVIKVESHTDQLVPYTFSYSDKYFTKNDSDKLNVSLAKISLGLTNSVSREEPSNCTLNRIGFSDVLGINTSEEEEVIDKTYYQIGHKKVDNKDMIAIAVKGNHYGAIWASNFNLGISGDHLGFSTPAKKIVEDVKKYINTYSLSNPSFWITGLSRGGAISQLVGKYLNNDETLKVPQKDIYVYTFSSPKCAVDDGKTYPFVRNIINKNDFLQANFKYDFIRLGYDYVINDISNYDKMVEFCKKLESDYDIPVFSPKTISYSEPYIIDDKNSKVTYDTFFSELMKLFYLDTSNAEQKEGLLDVSTREKYTENIQFAISYLVYNFIDISKDSIDGIISYFTEDISRIMKILNIFSMSADELYGLLVDIFNAGSITYDENALYLTATELSGALKTMFAIGGSTTFKTIITFAGNYSYFAFNHKAMSFLGYLETLE